jgi:hypothetical protein
MSARVSQGERNSWQSGVLLTLYKMNLKDFDFKVQYILSKVKIIENGWTFRNLKRSEICQSCVIWFMRWIWRMVSSGMIRHVALVGTDVSEELSVFFIKVTRIGELGTTLALTSKRRTLRRNTKFLQEPHGVTSQKTPFFIVTAVKTSNLTYEMNRLTGMLVDLKCSNLWNWQNVNFVWIIYFP